MSDPWGKQATDILSELVPNDLTQMAAGMHFIDPEIRIAGGPVYLTATGRAAAANPLIAPAMALTSPTTFGKMLLWWVDKKEAAQIMHELKANKLGPYGLAMRSPKLLTTEAGRAASKLGVRARRGGAIDTIRQSLYQPSAMEEQYIKGVN